MIKFGAHHKSVALSSPSLKKCASPSFFLYIRFVREKEQFKGEWVVPKRRAKKHPLAPKRPMSAFLKYSQSRRGKVKKDNPDMR